MIPLETDGPTAPPRSNGELVFDAPWQARAFGMAVALLESRGLGWDAFRRHLVAAIEAQPQLPYYDQFVDALAAFGEELGGACPDGSAGASCRDDIDPGEAEQDGISGQGQAAGAGAQGQG